MLADQCLEDAMASAVEDSYSAGVKLDGIIEEICDSLNCLISPHATHIDLRFEIELALA